MNEKEERDWAMFLHLSPLLNFIIPMSGLIAQIVMWSMKKDESKFVDEQGREALNFQISLFIYYIVASVLIFVLIGFILIPALVIFQIVMCIMAGLKAKEGIAYRYPATIRML